MFEFNRKIIKYFDTVRTEPKNVGRMILNDLENKYNGNQLHSYGKIINTFEGIDAVRDLDNYLKDVIPIHPLIHSKALDRAAQLIAEQKGRQGKTQNQKPKLIYEKIQRFGKVDGKIGQLISLVACSPEQIATYFVIDDGLTSRKRRRMILDPTYKYAGVGHSTHSQYQYITVILLAQNIQQGDRDNYILQHSRLIQESNTRRQSQEVEQNFHNSRQSSRDANFY